MITPRSYILILLTLFVFPAQAQNYFQQGNRYINIEIDSQARVGGGYFIGDRLVLNGSAGLNIDGRRKISSFAISMGLDYYTRYAILAPFWGGRVGFESNPGAFGASYSKGSRILFNGHWGINLFVIRDFSIAGKIGATILLDNPNGEDASTSFRSFSSGLEIRLFF